MNVQVNVLLSNCKQSIKSLSLLVGTTVYYAYLIIAGNRGDYELGPGPKVVLVASGGTLELHGKRKLSWTKLNTTAEKTENTDHLLYDHLVSSFLLQTIVLLNN